MAETHFTNLLIVVVVVVSFAAPFALGLAPRLRLPAVVLEIVAGIVIGPSGLGWVQIDEPVQILSLIGLAFLLFLAGLEIDVQRLRGPTLRLTSIGFVVSLVIGIGVGIAFHAGGLVRSPLFIAIVLSSTSLGVIVPVLKDSGNVGSSFGQLVIAAASIPDFGAIILLSLFFSGQGATDTTGKLIRLGLFAVLVAVIGFAIRGFECSDRLSSASTVARVPLFLLALLAVRGIPALLYSSQIGRRQAAIAGLLQATSLPFIVTATMIGRQIGVVSKPTDAGLIAAGLLSVIVFPVTGLALLRRDAPTATKRAGTMPSPAAAILSAEDRALCRTPQTTVGAMA
jgi:hypothetical protein